MPQHLISLLKKLNWILFSEFSTKTRLKRNGETFFLKEVVKVRTCNFFSFKYDSSSENSLLKSIFVGILPI